MYFANALLPLLLLLLTRIVPGTGFSSFAAGDRSSAGRSIGDAAAVAVGGADSEEEEDAGGVGGGGVAAPIISRRAAVIRSASSLLLLAGTTTTATMPVPALAAYIDPGADPPRITDRVFLDVLINGKDECRMEIGLFGEAMPRTVDNFARLFGSNSYAATNFYRVISDFSIQGGAIGDPSGKTGRSAFDGGRPFEPDNFNIKHTKEGLLSAVRGLDGRIDSRFFINCSDDAGWADDRYAAFGIVERGMDVVKRIEKLPVKPPKNNPVTEVKILRSGTIKAEPTPGNEAA